MVSTLFLSESNLELACFWKPPAREISQLPQARGIVTSPGCADACTAFPNTCQRKGCILFSFPQRKSGWAGTCTAYHSCLRFIFWYCKINTLSAELEKTYPCLQKIKVQQAFFKMLPNLFCYFSKVLPGGVF